MTEARDGGARGEAGAPRVTVVVTARNEARFIRRCLETLLDNDYPADRREILVVDGLSEDGTRDIVREVQARHPEVRLIDNPRRITPVAVNLGILHASGDVVLWMGAHNHVQRDYISLCIRYLQEYGADNVGGRIITVPQKDGAVGRAIVAALSSPFGVGNAAFRMEVDAPRWVDTVFGGCYPKEVFRRIGLFHEQLVRSQDMEFNIRLRNAGGRILLVPEIVSYYAAKSDLSSFCRHNWTNGAWAVLPFLYTRHMPVRPRHLIPLAFVLSILASAALALVRPAWGLPVLLGIFGLYVLATIAAAFRIALRRRDLRYLLLMPVAFACLHVPYGLGSLGALLQVIVQQVARKSARVEAPRLPS